MKRKILLAGLIIVSVCGVSPLAASASTPKPKITSFSPTSGNAGSKVTISGTNLEYAISVTFNGKVASIISDHSTKIRVQVPGAASTGYIEVKTAGGTAKSATEFTVGLDSSSTTATPSSSGIGIGSDNSDSAVVKGNSNRGNPTGTVTFYECGPTVTPEPCTSTANPVGSPVVVTAESGKTSSASSASFTASSTGYWCFAGYYSGDSNYEASSYTTTNQCFDVYVPLDDTTSVVSDATGYCAILTSSGVDCWGYGADGELGNGTFSNSANPVTVEGVGGTGTLTGVARLVGGPGNYCALLTSGEVDCWGANNYGELGNGTFSNSANPVAVEGVGGTGTLADVTSLVGGAGNYCALLTSGGVDCWGYGEQGQLGNGTFYTSSSYGSPTPVAVEGVGGTGTLSGVTNLIGGDNFAFDLDGTESPEYGNYCALLTSGGVDCWGFGGYGELGNGIDYTACDFGSGNCGSDTPVAVDGVGGTGTLTGVASLASDAYSFCALLTSGGVDCWGSGDDGQLGNGGNSGSDTPEAVEGVGGTGTLTGVSSLVGDGDFEGYCALLISDGVDCWGYGFYGDLGNGSTAVGFTPVAVEGVGGTGTLTGVKSLVGDFQGYCALITSGGVDCWGDGENGELGDGTFYAKYPYTSLSPVAVDGVGGTGTLTGVTSLVGGFFRYCAQLTSGGADCWGSGYSGALGDGWYYTTGNGGSAFPVEVG